MSDDDSAFAGGSESAVPVVPRTPYNEWPVSHTRRAETRELGEWLVAEGRDRINDPDDDEVAKWRRVVDYAKPHGLEPVDKRIGCCAPTPTRSGVGARVCRCELLPIISK
ncbi:hypothetical protein GCM10017557_18640 [Streptomyces aurantiacus]|uniref:Uncharacterized protein n=1 Tax=Streptomyces aurantiacus TaxID=47760 RepID=A0A7G1P1R2_9ACTN|nr:hypothetical protein GCM10017557_18640 [Streptomyces aurantiacus]